jgi:hypothetical protein
VESRQGSGRSTASAIIGSSVQANTAPSQPADFISTMIAAASAHVFGGWGAREQASRTRRYGAIRTRHAQSHDHCGARNDDESGDHRRSRKVFAKEYDTPKCRQR